MRGIEIPELGSSRETLLYEMIRHERFIEADRWEVGLRVLVALMGNKWEEASKIATLIRRELMLSLNHITPTLDYAILKAETCLRQGIRVGKDEQMVESWTVKDS